MSSETKFTKGEWSYFDHGVGEIVVHDDNDDCICSLDDSQSGYAWKDGYSTNGQAKANAHLISAAPDIYMRLWSRLTI